MSSNDDMRYSAKHKQETRERIVRTASRHFRQRGEEGVGIADLMSKLKLTHGGFYKHFDSKEELLAEAIAKAFEDVEERFADMVSRAKPGTELKTLIENYLSLEHCANPGEGCPMAALASEIGRLPPRVRAQIDQAIKRRGKRVSGLMPGATQQEREKKTMVLLSGLIGTINVARLTGKFQTTEAQMNFVAWKMLTGDRAKYLGLIFTIAFCTFLLENQTSIFAGILKRTGSQIADVTDADIWVMDSKTEYFEQTKALKDTDLTRVRGVDGVQWAVKLFKGSPVARTPNGKFGVTICLGLDDATLAGAPRAMLLGSWERLREPDSVVIDKAGYVLLFPGEPLELDRTVELND